jgi:DNA-binding NtrC family response regulator
LIYKKGLIAVVDDELDIAQLFHDALKKTNGFTIFAFTDPNVAFEHFSLNREHYALVISDLKMPIINGIELIKRTKKLNPCIRTILMTAFDITNVLFQEHVVKESINGILQKPIPLRNLYAEVDNQLQTYELERSQL